MTDLTLVIVNYKNPSDLYDCLATLTAYAKHDYHIIVADNNTDRAEQDNVDGVVSRIAYRPITVKHYWENLFPGGAWNRSMEFVDTEYVCMMQEDLVFVPAQHRFWERLIGVAKDPRVGMVGPSSNGADDYQYFLRTEAPERVKVHYIHGMMHLLRSDTLREIGPYATDITQACIDMCVRMAKAGLDLVIDRGAFVFHSGRGAFNRALGHDGAVRWLIDLIEDEPTIFMKRFGVETFYDYMNKSPNLGLKTMLYGDMGYAALLRELARQPEEWKPTGGTDGTV